MAEKEQEESAKEGRGGRGGRSNSFRQIAPQLPRGSVTRDTSDVEAKTIRKSFCVQQRTPSRVICGYSFGKTYIGKNEQTLSP